MCVESIYTFRECIVFFKLQFVQKLNYKRVTACCAIFSSLSMTNFKHYTKIVSLFKYFTIVFSEEKISTSTSGVFNNT